MKYLYARDIAERRGITERAARSWLSKLEREHGARVVGRTGARLFTTDDALATIGPGFDPTRARLTALDERLRRLGATVRAMAAAIESLDAALRRLGGERHNGIRVEIGTGKSANRFDRLRAARHA